MKRVKLGFFSLLVALIGLMPVGADAAIYPNPPSQLGSYRTAALACAQRYLGFTSVVVGTITPQGQGVATVDIRASAQGSPTTLTIFRNSRNRYYVRTATSALVITSATFDGKNHRIIVKGRGVGYEGYLTVEIRAIGGRLISTATAHAGSTSMQPFTSYIGTGGGTYPIVTNIIVKSLSAKDGGTVAATVTPLVLR
jgi:hypothetical protein